MCATSKSKILVLSLLLQLCLLSSQRGVKVSALMEEKCLSDSVMNARFDKSYFDEVAVFGFVGDFSDFRGGIPPQEKVDEVCCMSAVCGLACPKEVEKPIPLYGICVGIAVTISFIVGIGTIIFVAGTIENFFVAGRSLPTIMVVATLAAQSLDSNALLGNVDLSYRYSFWDGAVLPMGLGLSLVLNGLFLAGRINRERDILTLPDIFAKRYGPIVEVLVSFSSIVSFVMLLAGNLVGMSVICGYVWNFSEQGSIWLAMAILWSYTSLGGLFSVAVTDVLQGLVGWSGCALTAIWFIRNKESAPPPSIGFPGYIYPDTFGEGGPCDMYQGVNCTFNSGSCCYNEELWCPRGGMDCDRYDRGAYPFGDLPIYDNQMTDPLALSPSPNAYLWNWATIIILGFGNLAALDFQTRCMASKSPQAARIGCFIAGAITFIVGIPFAYLGAATRFYYGPDSVHGEFEADSCSTLFGSPSCAEWLPDKLAFPKLLTQQAPNWLGAWCMVSIIAASMSTADGAILAIGTVATNNILYHFRWMDRRKLLDTVRWVTLPFAIVASTIGAYYRSSHSAGSTGYLLIVAFDIMLATTVVPLFRAFYTKNPSSRAALLSVMGGGITRFVLEFVLPKDGSLLYKYDSPEFLDFGSAASLKVAPNVDANVTDVWDPLVEECHQEPFSDSTGVDSLTAFGVSAFLFISVQYVEHWKQKPLFTFRGMDGYNKPDINQLQAEIWEYEGEDHKHSKVFLLSKLLISTTMVVLLVLLLNL